MKIPEAYHDVLIVMTRLPREGANKTRLIPALGPVGATAFHDRLARHAVGRAASYVLQHPSTHLQIQLEGGTAAEGRAWLGEADYHIQQPGDLGQRMQAAVELAFSNGARRVVVTGTDCPSIDEELLGRAFAALAVSHLIFGPAVDGGYYLVGLSRPCAEIFQNIAWGGAEVLRQSLAAARLAKLKVATLELLSDVDVPADVPAAEALLHAGSSVPIIIPQT